MYAKLTVLLWWLTIALELLILARLFRQKMIGRYPFFVGYLSCVFLGSASGYFVYAFRQEWYGYWYWSWEFLCVIAGYSVVFEIIERGLGEYQGVRKLFRNVALGVFGGIVGFISLQSMRSGNAITLRTSVEVERDLRAAEAVLLALIIAALVYYGIQLGKNLRGIVLGYGLCVATIVIGDAFRAYGGTSVHSVFSAMRSWSYLVSLVIWGAALWSYQPSTLSNRPIEPASNHQVLVSQTREAVESVRGELEKATRQ